MPDNLISKQRKLSHYETGAICSLFSILSSYSIFFSPLYLPDKGSNLYILSSISLHSSLSLFLFFSLSVSLPRYLSVSIYLSFSLSFPLSYYPFTLPISLSFPSLATSSLSLSLSFPVKYSPTYRRCFISFSSLLFSRLLSSSLIIHPINILSHVTLIFCMKNVISRVEMLQKQQTISIDRFRQQTDDLKVTVGRDLDEASVDSAGTY